jgi:iron complex transport system substrate-binding protein
LISQFRLLGILSGEKERAKHLIDYTQETLSLIHKLQPRLKKYKKVHFYFAEGLNGLRTECGNSFHIQPFKYAGALNAIHCKMLSQYGMQKISLEKVMASNPDFIVVMDRHFAKDIYKDERWNVLRAVQEHHVLLVPNLPFNYITRPPSFMRLIGIRWLIHSFYPQLIPNVSLKQDLQRFNKLFFRSQQ